MPAMLLALAQQLSIYCQVLLAIPDSNHLLRITFRYHRFELTDRLSVVSQLRNERHNVNHHLLQTTFCSQQITSRWSGA